jgi:hypothetical protein
MAPQLEAGVVLVPRAARVALLVHQEPLAGQTPSRVGRSAASGQAR